MSRFHKIILQSAFGDSKTKMSLNVTKFIKVVKTIALKMFRALLHKDTFLVSSN